MLWTDEQIAFTKRNYRYLTRAHMARSLGCTESGVRRLMQTLGIEPKKLSPRMMPPQVRSITHLPMDFRVDEGRLYVKYTIPSMQKTYCCLRDKGTVPRQQNT